MENDVGMQATRRPRELGLVGTAGSFIAAFGLLWIMMYFVFITWLASLLVDGFYHLWIFTRVTGWVLIMIGGIIFVTGVGMMISDWKRRAPEPLLAPEEEFEKPIRTTGYDATQPRMEQHVET